MGGETGGDKRVPARGRPLRIVTYNVHKCRGLDQRVRPDRIADVLRPFDADVIALQEVLSVQGQAPEADQARFLAGALCCGWHMADNRRLRGGAYGNVVLTRLPILFSANYDISCTGREPRGCQRLDLQLSDGAAVHFFNVHLGTSFFERRRQAHLLLSESVLLNPGLKWPRIVAGDFNEWTRGLLTRLMRQHFQAPDLREHLQRRRTYPGVWPVLHLDHVYYERGIVLERLELVRHRQAMLASDHLPLVADLRVNQGQRGDADSAETSP